MAIDKDLLAARRAAHIENEFDLQKILREQEILHANDEKLNQRMDIVEKHLNELALYSGYTPLRKPSVPPSPHLPNGNSGHVH